MSDQTVTIKDNQWVVNIVNSYTDLITGLSGQESLTPGTGMLFDLGYDCEQIQIDMTRMLFPLDIIFINSAQVVVRVMHNVQPREKDVAFYGETSGARYFLEVNAGEANEGGIEVGDAVVIQGYAQSSQFNVSALISSMFIMVMLVMMMRVTAKMLDEPERESVSLLPHAAVPQQRCIEKNLEENDLEYLADSPEFLAYTIEDIGYRGRIDDAFQRALERTRELR
jgi:uncharacterized membrane protein (UPF0127 family)